jgi:peptide methionine sulfoxide reductase MsrB
MVIIIIKNIKKVQEKWCLFKNSMKIFAIISTKNNKMISSCGWPRLKKDLNKLKLTIKEKTSMTDLY